jgi:hypothetical protein
MSDDGGVPNLVLRVDFNVDKSDIFFCPEIISSVKL